MQEKIVQIINEMAEYLSIAQMKKLQEVILRTFSENELEKQQISNEEFLEMFLDAKRVEGCSERTIQYYKVTAEHMLSQTEKEIRKITTDEMRSYLADYQKRNNCSNVTIDNIRRNISSFFTWLEEEDYILKSPMRRIHKIKTKTVVKSVITDEGIEQLRDHCTQIRDLAMIDLLYSTGIRVGELVNLNIGDIDFEERECVVYGKGDKERRVYFTERCKRAIINYLKEREDKGIISEYLFCSSKAPNKKSINTETYKKLNNRGYQVIVNKMQKMANIEMNITPHTFRHTMATFALRSGMAPECIQQILGHNDVGLTLRVYAKVAQTEVEHSYRKLVS